MSQRPSQHLSIDQMDPVLILSHSYTYYAPREILAVRLVQPMAITLGAAPSVTIDEAHRHFHIELAETVEDKVEGQSESGEEMTVLKTVHVAPVHAAIVLNEGRLFYKHLGK